MSLGTPLFSLNDNGRELGGVENDGDCDIGDADLTDKITPVCFLVAQFLSSALLIIILELVDGSFDCKADEDEGGIEQGVRMD